MKYIWVLILLIVTVASILVVAGKKTNVIKVPPSPPVPISEAPTPTVGFQIINPNKLMQKCIDETGWDENKEREKIRQQMCPGKPPEECGPIDLVPPQEVLDCYRKYQ